MYSNYNGCAKKSACESNDLYTKVRVSTKGRIKL